MKKLILTFAVVALGGIVATAYGEDSQRFIQDNDRNYIYDNDGKKKGYIQQNDGYRRETNIYDLDGNKKGKLGGSNPYVQDKPKSEFEEFLRKNKK